MDIIKKVRKYFFILILLLLLLSCGFSNTVATSPNKSDALSVTKWITSLIVNKEPSKISAVIGDSGVNFAGYQQGFDFLGYNNSKEIADELNKAIKNSQPQCLGYIAYSDKVNIYFSDVNFERSDLNNIDIVSFLIFKNNQDWELVIISPVPYEAAPNSSELTSCP